MAPCASARRPCASRRPSSGAQDRIQQACSDRLTYLGHEFRAPLGAIAGMAEVLNHGALSDEQQRCVDTILTSCSALGVLVDGFLDFSRIESGQLALKRSDFDLHDVLDDVLDLFAHSAGAKGIEYGALAAAGVPTALLGDPYRLRQVLINLVGNALKFTDQGEVVVQVTVESASSRSAALRFQVRDSGVGISDRVRQALFQPFSGFDQFAGESQSGLGLGLYIAKYLVTQMGGEIGVESNAPEPGSSFWFTVLLEKRRADAPDVWTPPDALRGARVLLLHRPSPLRDVLAAQAAACGVSVRAEHELAGGLMELRAAAYAGTPYSAVLVDSGLDPVATYTLRQSIEKDRDLPTPKMVVLVHMGAEAERTSNTMRRAEVWLTKPVTQSRLADALLLALGKREGAGSKKPESGHTPTAASGAAPDGGETERPDARERPILLVEDNPVTRLALSELLRKMGFAVDLADNGSEGVKTALENHYDVILMDCRLPELDGAQASVEIRRREGDQKRTPIICLSGTSLERVQDYLDRGDFDDYLRKPASAEEIRAKLEQWSSGGKALGEEEFSFASALADPVARESLRRTFLEDGRARLEVLAQAVAEDDFAAVTQAAHAFHGGCLMLGVSELAEACESLETVSKGGDRASLAGSFDRVRKEFHRVEESWLPVTGPTGRRGQED